MSLASGRSTNGLNTPIAGSQKPSVQLEEILVDWERGRGKWRMKNTIGALTCATMRLYWRQSFHEIAPAIAATIRGRGPNLIGGLNDE
jgi:hypothetical protein